MATLHRGSESAFPQSHGSRLGLPRIVLADLEPLFRRADKLSIEDSLRGFGIVIEKFAPTAFAAARMQQVERPAIGQMHLPSCRVGFRKIVLSLRSKFDFHPGISLMRPIAIHDHMILHLAE